MKKTNVSPLSLNKEVIAKLDELQLDKIVGGANRTEQDEECWIASCEKQSCGYASGTK